MVSLDCENTGVGTLGHDSTDYVCHRYSGASFHSPRSLVHETNDYLVVASCRLSNRKFLDKKLGDTKELTDPQTILLAHTRWGNHCARELDGSFAFAIYHKASRQTFCACDPLGSRPLFYTFKPGKLFAFASDLSSLRRVKGIGQNVNERRILDFLCAYEGIDDSTFYTDILKLPAASCLTLQNERISRSSYWSPFDAIRSDQTNIDEAMHFYNAAVAKSTKGENRIGVLLSGGVDSASVAAIACANESTERVEGISVIKESPECGESALSRTIANTLGLRHHCIWIEKSHDYLEEFLESARTVDDPFATTMSLVGIGLQAASRLGFSTILSGVDGDLAFGLGLGYPTYLARRRRYITAFLEASKTGRRHGNRWSRIKGVLPIPGSFRKVVRRARTAFRQSSAIPELLNKAFANRMGYAERKEQYLGLSVGLDKGEPAEVRASRIAHPHTSAGLARYYHCARIRNIDIRHPLLDKSLLECTINLPWYELSSDGWPKIGLRRKMASDLPAEVCFPNAPGNLMPTTTNYLLQKHCNLDDLHLQISRDLGGYTDNQGLQNLFDRYRKERSDYDAAVIWELTCLRFWVARH